MVCNKAIQLHIYPISRRVLNHVITSQVPVHQLDYLVDSVDPTIMYVIPKRD